LRPNKEAKIRKYWNWYHHWFGRIALFFGALNIVLGIQIGGAGNEWKLGYGFLLSIILIALMIDTQSHRVLFPYFTKMH